MTKNPTPDDQDEPTADEARRILDDFARLLDTPPLPIAPTPEPAPFELTRPEPKPPKDRRLPL